MRCQFCGWDNPDGKDTCDKCNKPLSGGDVPVAEPTTANRPTERRNIESFNPKKTVREGAAVKNETVAQDADVCPKCGYKLENGVCSYCGYSVGKPQPAAKPESIDPKKTMRPIRKAEKEGSFSLIPISEEDGNPEGEALLYEGNEVILNRENTDAKNTTITSVAQANVTLENGKWTIEDKSEYKTTFVQAARKIEIQDGDLILLGNQLYRFKS